MVAFQSITAPFALRRGIHFQKALHPNKIRAGYFLLTPFPSADSVLPFATSCTQIWKPSASRLNRYTRNEFGAGANWKLISIAPFQVRFGLVNLGNWLIAKMPKALFPIRSI